MEIIKRNWKIKLLSVVLAIFFWSFVIVSENPVVTTRVPNVPVVFENLDKLENRGLVLTTLEKKNIEMYVNGQRSNIINITPQHIRASINLDGLNEGNHAIDIKYSLPNGITIEDAPKNLTVNIEKIINKNFDVAVNTVGNLPKDYLLESAKATPDKIVVRGSRSKLDSIDKIVSDLSLTNLVQNQTHNSEIYAVNKNGEKINSEGIIFGQAFVNINTVVFKQKEVDINVKFKGDSPENLRVEKYTLNRSKVLIKGPELVINSINSIDTQDIDKTKILDSRQIPVNLSLPTDVELVNTDLTYILDVEISNKTTKEFSIPKSNVEVNISSNKSYNIENENISLILNGYPSDLEKIKESDIKLHVDLLGKNSRRISIKPKVFVKDKEISEKDIDRVANVIIAISN